MWVNCSNIAFKCFICFEAVFTTVEFNYLKNNELTSWSEFKVSYFMVNGC